VRPVFSLRERGSSGFPNDNCFKFMSEDCVKHGWKIKPHPASVFVILFVALPQRHRIRDTLQTEGLYEDSVTFLSRVVHVEVA
jgi:hypothetical protein